MMTSLLKTRYDINVCYALFILQLPHHVERMEQRKKFLEIGSDFSSILLSSTRLFVFLKHKIVNSIGDKMLPRNVYMCVV